MKTLSQSNETPNKAVFIGTYPGLTKEMLGYMAETITQLVQYR